MYIVLLPDAPDVGQISKKARLLDASSPYKRRWAWKCSKKVKMKAISSVVICLALTLTGNPADGAKLKSESKLGLECPKLALECRPPTVQRLGGRDAFGCPHYNCVVLEQRKFEPETWKAVDVPNKFEAKKRAVCKETPCGPKEFKLEIETPGGCPKRFCYVYVRLPDKNKVG